MADKFSQSFIKEELHLYRWERKHLPLQFVFARWTHKSSLKPAHYLGKQASVTPSQKDVCHLILTDCADNDLSVVNIDKGKNTISKPLH